MWAVAVITSGTEFLMRDRLLEVDLSAWLPYIREKQIITVIPPRTTSNPRPRAYHKAAWNNVARWPGYLLAQVLSSEELSALRKVKGIKHLVKNGDGVAALLPCIKYLQRGCAADGRILAESELHGFTVGALLRFVAGSSFAGLGAQVTSVEPNGRLGVLVENKFKAEAHYTELASAIG